MELKAHPFFKEVEPHEVEALLKSADIKNFESGTIIFEAGTQPDALNLILDGIVAFRKKLPNGDTLTVGQSTEGAYFGEIGVLTGDPRSLQAYAAEDCQIAEIPGEALVNFINNMHGPMEHLMKSVIGHLHRTTNQYIDDRLEQEKMSVVGSMTNTIIHDFKNPFCLISLSAQLIRQKHNDPESEKLCINIEKQVDRMVAMTTELSEFSRGESNVIKSDISLLDVISEFKSLNHPYFNEENVKIEIDVKDVRLMGSKPKLLRVLQNLVGNAIDALRDKEGIIKIRTEIDRINKRVTIHVEDNAGGIPEEIRPKFFDPFVTFGKSEGTGLGSAIARSIVEGHEGTLSFDTETGRGTIFHIELPYVKAL